MRKRQTFLLTILTPDNGTDCFCGKLKVISSGKTCTFTDMEELYRLIASEMDAETLQRLSHNSLTRSSSEDPSGSRDPAGSPAGEPTGKACDAS